jgi:hypothetical protein
MLALLCLLLFVAAVGYILYLERVLRGLEQQAAWARADAQAWTRWLSHAAPVTESSTSLSKLLEALWPHLIAERVKDTISTVLTSALAELPEKCATLSVFMPRHANVILL